jgi:amino acid permease
MANSIIGAGIIGLPFAFKEAVKCYAPFSAYLFMQLISL